MLPLRNPLVLGYMAGFRKHHDAKARGEPDHQEGGILEHPAMRHEPWEAPFERWAGARMDGASSRAKEARAGKAPAPGYGVLSSDPCVVRRAETLLGFETEIVNPAPIRLFKPVLGVEKEKLPLFEPFS